MRRLSGFRFSRENLSAIALTFLVVGVAFGAFFVLPPAIAMGMGAVAVLVSGLYCLMLLSTLVEPGELPAPFRQMVGAARNFSKRRID